MPRTILTVHPDDNVATLLDFNTEDLLTQNGLSLAAPVPFGHKVALQTIEMGCPVVKYGVIIGLATQNINIGEHVHVHNCR
jgi:altronate hydrolase